MCFVAEMETGRLKTGSHRAADRKQKTLPIPPHTRCVLQSVCGSEKRSRREKKISLLKTHRSNEASNSLRCSVMR